MVDIKTYKTSIYPTQRSQHIGIDCPNTLITAVQAQKDVFRDVAENMGLAEVVCLNATRLLCEPMSKIKHSALRVCLELQWIAMPEK